MPESMPPESIPQPRQGRHLWRRLLIVVLAFLLLLGAVIASVYAGLYFGERDREARHQRIVQQHYSAGLEALNAGKYERAEAEFQYVLQLDPQNALAQHGLEEAKARLVVQPTPTSEAASSLADQLFAQAQEAYQAKKWTDAANTLTQLRALDPSYQEKTVEDMLFHSLYNAGMQFLDQDQLESGIFYLDQAVALRPLDADAVNQRNLAARYLEAQGYWGVDWKLCIQRFANLYNTHPDYRDVAQKLYKAYIAYADYLAEQGEMCPAETNYSQALRLYADPQIDQKRASASQVCLVATPTPISGTEQLMTPQPIAGFTSGRLAYPVFDSGNGVYDLFALYADGRILRVATNADQPWWEWGTGRVAYRDKATADIKMELPEEGVPLQLLPPGGQAWPTLSADGQRVAYASADETGTWYIYIANTNGEGTPRKLAPGWAPAWSRTGLLAYTGCDAEGQCGIFVDNPDDGQPGTRLTGSENDTAVSWAPAGNLMAYMSNVTGNWDIYLLNPQGGVQQFITDPSDDGLPVWSPDGGSLAFVSNRDGQWAIYIRPFNGQTVQRIVNLGTALPGWDNQRLSWSP